jgi:hypothetical protein
MMQKLIKASIALMLMLLLVAACAQAPSAEFVEGDETAQLVDLAVGDLTERLSLPDPSQVRVLNIEPVREDTADIPPVPITGQLLYRIILAVDLPDDQRQFIYYGSGNQVQLDLEQSNMPVMNRAHLLNQLQVAGLNADTTDQAARMEEFIFTMPDPPVMVEGEVVHVFEYIDYPAAAAEMDRVQPEGVEIDGEIWQLPEPSQIFHQDRVIVIYTGENQRIIDGLTEVMGPAVY